MGVRFYDDQENIMNRDAYTTTTTTSSIPPTICNCNACIAARTTAATTSTATQTSVNPNNFQKSGILREIIGNGKEVRIDDNNHNLRIVGNNNRIRISINVGDITIIGNNTRLKIKTNHGLLKYTGNDGRICLGKDSSEQLVEYSGCNGVLKVQNSRNSSQVNNAATDDANEAVDDEVDNEILNNLDQGNTSFKNKEKFKSKKPKSNSSKFYDSSCCSSSRPSEVFKCHQNIFNHKNSNKKHFGENLSNLQQPKKIVHNFGNIVIANSSNICITPTSYTY